MSNGAYGLVPAALRETGRTMRDIIGTEAEGRVSKARQGLEMTKLKYGLGKDIREQRQRAEQLEYDRYMDTPMTVEGVLDTFPGMTDENRDKMRNSEMFGLIKNEKTMGGGQPVTPRTMITFFSKLRDERKAEAVAEKKEVSDLVKSGNFTPASIEVYRESDNIGDLKRLASVKTTEADTQRRFDAKQKALARKNRADLYTAVNKEYTEQFTDSWTKKPVEGAPNRRQWVKETVNRRLEEEVVASARETQVQGLATSLADLIKNNPNATDEELKAMLAESEGKSTQQPGAQPTRRRGGAGGGFTEDLTISEAATALGQAAKKAAKPATGEQIQRTLKRYAKEGIVDKESFEKVAKELGIAASWAWDSVKAIGQTRIPFTSGLR